MKMERVTKRGAIEPRGARLCFCVSEDLLKGCSDRRGSSIFVFKSSLLPVLPQLCQNRDVNLIDCIVCTKWRVLISFRVTERWFDSHLHWCLSWKAKFLYHIQTIYTHKCRISCTCFSVLWETRTSDVQRGYCCIYFCYDPTLIP